MGQLEQNKDVARRYFEDLWRDDNVVPMDTYVHPTFYQHHARNRDDDLLEPAALRAWIAALHETLSEVRMHVELMFAEQDLVMLYLRGTGTHKAGTHNADTGKAAAGAPVRWTTTALVRLIDRKVAESWVISDTLGVLQQISVVPRLG